MISSRPSKPSFFIWIATCLLVAFEVTANNLNLSGTVLCTTLLHFFSYCNHAEQVLFQVHSHKHAYADEACTNFCQDFILVVNFYPICTNFQMLCMARHDDEKGCKVRNIQTSL